MVEEVMRDPISVGALKIDGAKIMEMTGEKPGRRIGWVLHALLEEVMRDPISVGALKIDGAKIMEMTGEKPGRRIGWVLHALLEEVIEDPKKNTEEYLEERIKILFALSDKELEMLGRAAKEKKEETEEAEVKEIRKRHWVE